MGYPLQVSLRYMGSKRKGAFISAGTAFAIIGVALGVAALATALSVTGGFKTEFRNKVLGVNAHVLVMKYSSDFREYRDVMDKVQDIPGVLGVAPFIINPMMVSHGDRTATGVLLKGVDPSRMPSVLDLPQHIQLGSLAGLRRAGAGADEPSGWLPFPLAQGTPQDAGVVEGIEDGERDDAGRNVALLRAIEQTIEDDEAKWAAAAAAASASAERGEDQARGEADRGGASKPSDKSNGADGGKAARDATSIALSNNAPRGSVVPEGGYKSELPEDDLLPPDILPDPCGNPEEVAQLPGIVVGSTLARNLDLALGACVQVTSPTIGYTFSRGTIRPAMAKQFRVIAVFEAGFDQYDSKLVYTDLAEAQSFYDQGDTVTGVEMKVADIDRARHTGKLIDEKLANGLYHTMDWSELNHGLFTALLIQQIAMGVVLSLIIVVAAFTVVATLIMVVLDKKREIAVLKAMGATDEAVLRSFMYQGGLIGLIGTSVGLVLGLVLCKGLLIYAFPLDPKVYFISRLPVDARPSNFILTGVIAVLTCLLATSIPALYAARLRPAEGLRAQ